MNKKKVVPPTADPLKNPYPEDVMQKLQERGFRVIAIDALGIAKSLENPKVENVIIVGSLSTYIPFPLAAWENAVRESVPSKTVEINIEAFKKGREYTAVK